jgi:hypothetical protein
MNRPGITLPAALAAVALLASCSAAAPRASTVAPTAPPASASALESGVAVTLDRFPENGACDAMGVDYHSFTLHVDPDAEVQVWAEADTGKQLQVEWAEGFTATAEGVIFHPSGAEAGREGTTVDFEPPGTANPTLAGSFVCASSNTLWISDTTFGEG